MLPTWSDCLQSFWEVTQLMGESDCCRFLLALPFLLLGAGGRCHYDGTVDSWLVGLVFKQRDDRKSKSSSLSFPW